MDGNLLKISMGKPSDPGERPSDKWGIASAISCDWIGRKVVSMGRLKGGSGDRLGSSFGSRGLVTRGAENRSRKVFAMSLTSSCGMRTGCPCLFLIGVESVGTNPHLLLPSDRAR